MEGNIMQKPDKRNLVLAGLLALILSLLQISGWQISMDYGSSFHQSAFFQNIGLLTPIQCIIWFIIEFCIVFFCILFCFQLAEKKQCCLQPSPRKLSAFFQTFRPKWLLVFSMLYVIWLFFLWGCYPGFYNYDGGNQLVQVMYDEVPYDAHHPLLHTLFSGGIITLGYHLNNTDLTLGVFLHNMIQMAICAACLTYALFYIAKRTANYVLMILSFAFYALCPPIVMLAMSTTKDVLCYSFFLVAILQLQQLYEKCRSDASQSKIDWIRPGIFLLLSCLIRKNIIYAIVIYSVVALCFFCYQRKKQCLLYLSVIILYFIIDNFLLFALDAIPGSINEMFSVPYQQMARLYVEEGKDAFTEEEYILLSQIVPPDALTCYDPVMGDHTKINFYPGLETLLENKWEYIKFWIKKGFEYPKIFLDSFLYNTYQAWYPWTTNLEYRYNRYFDITGWQTEYGRPNWQGLYNYYTAVSTGSYTQYPVIRLLFSTGTMFWAAIIAFFYCIWRKHTPAVLALLLVLLVCATCFLGPVADVRYYLILFYLLPVCISFFCRGGLPSQ